MREWKSSFTNTAYTFWNVFTVLFGIGFVILVIFVVPREAHACEKTTVWIDLTPPEKVPFFGDT